MVKIKPKPKPKVEPANVSEPDLLAKIRRMSRADLGGLKIHVWPLRDGGYQGNVSIRKDGHDKWSVFIARNPLDALDGALSSKMRGLKLDD